ncbi:MAG: hypothetical protein KJS91_04705 [Planctomycetes bacterium]|nr:hypothetical protein [Planctomycetota bacterium]
MRGFMTGKALGLLAGAALGAMAADNGPLVIPAAPDLGFGVLKAQDAAAARAKAEELARIGGTQPDPAKVQSLWREDRILADEVADTIALGHSEAARLLAVARGNGPAPSAQPAWLKDEKVPLAARANVAVAYARALSNRRIHEDALEALKPFKPEQVADPATYLFHRAVSEHALVMKAEASATLERLLGDMPELPERYRALGSLMALDVQTWRDKDLGWVSRKMEQITRRLDNLRGGKQTQKIQKEVVLRLDEMIKELENQQKNQSGSNGGNCPNGGQQEGQPGNTVQPSSPQQDSIGGQGGGKGDVDGKKAVEIAEVWGKLPDRERAQAMRDLAARAPAKYRETLEIYFKKLNEAGPAKPVR